MEAPTCNCGLVSRLTNGKEIYPHRPDLHSKAIYVCDGCGGRVGCHPGTTNPLGTPADAELRNARMKVHELMDPIWKTAEKSPCYSDGKDRKAIKIIRRAARSRVYAYLAHHMKMDRSETHTGMFNMQQCREAYRLLMRKTYSDIRAFSKEQKANEKSEAA